MRFLAVVALRALAQNTLRTTPDVVRGHFVSINRKILDMAKDFPEDKYDFRLKPEIRSFREDIVHIAGGNIYPAKAGRGENFVWDDNLEVDPKNYRIKADVVAMFEKTPTPFLKLCRIVPSGRRRTLISTVFCDPHHAKINVPPLLDGNCACTA